MTKQTINIGMAPNTKTGDPLRAAFTKVNANFTELYNTAGPDVQIPSQTGNAGKYLKTNGTTLSWDIVAGGVENLEIDGGYASTNFTAEITVDGGGV